MSGIEDTKAYYDAQSSHYSESRYEGKLDSYIQFVFRRRRAIFLGWMDKLVSKAAVKTIMEIGCADGILLRNLTHKFPTAFTKLIGMDISEGMLTQARNKTKDQKITYVLRGSEALEKNDLIIELGVHIYELRKELEYVSSFLIEGGYFIYSAVSSSSIHTHLKLKHVDYTLPTYKETEAALSEYFEIIEMRPYGFFVPKLWAVPFIGRLFQSSIDRAMSVLTPDLFHEKIYLLRKK